MRAILLRGALGLLAATILGCGVQAPAPGLTSAADAFLAIGSPNGDTLTFENNQELDLILSNPQTVAEFRRTISDADWERTSPVTAEDTKLGFASRPLLGLLEWIDAYL